MYEIVKTSIAPCHVSGAVSCEIRAGQLYVLKKTQYDENDKTGHLIICTARIRRTGWVDCTGARVL